jgi:hypothetical protein
MLKKSFQIIGLTLLIGFSFFYTEKVAMIVRDQDPLMIKIQEYEEKFNKESVNAILLEDSIIPGINACVVDTNSSYTNMKRIGSYNANMIEYKEIKPKLSLDNIYDKYIIMGNKNNFEVALVFKINVSRYIFDILNLLSKKTIKASFFIDGKLIEKELKYIYDIINKNHEIYNLGYDGKYDKDLLVWTNNMIENMSYNMSKYCLVTTDNQKVMDVCSNNKMYTIKSDIVIDYSKTLNLVKNEIKKGSIIVFDVNDKTIDELSKVLLFLNGKGFSYNLLSDHLSEKGCISK